MQLYKEILYPVEGFFFFSSSFAMYSYLQDVSWLVEYLVISVDS